MTTCRKRTDHRPMDGHDPKCANLRALPGELQHYTEPFLILFPIWPGSSRRPSMGKIWCRRAASYILRIILPTSLLSQLINSVLYGRSSIDGTMGIWINCVSIIIVCVISACSTRNGQAWSHHFLGLQVVDQYSNLPISGVRMGLREIAHCVDFVPCFIGFLWPLWDTKGQTFADKIMRTTIISIK